MFYVCNLISFRQCTIRLGSGNYTELAVALVGDDAFLFVQRGEGKMSATLQWKEKVHVRCSWRGRSIWGRDRSKLNHRL
jgi:hypothetical protein